MEENNLLSTSLFRIKNEKEKKKNSIESTRQVCAKKISPYLYTVTKLVCVCMTN